MKTSYQINFIHVFLVPFLMVFSLWIVYWVELRFDFNFNEHGLLPRTISGLQGILFSPFIHSGIEHLYNNSLPLFILLAALFYFYKSLRYKVLLWGLLFTGIITWIIGRDSFHIGASGLVYMLTSFLFFKGIWSKNYRLIALSLIVVFLYGSMVWGIFPQKERISWEGHLAGLLTGILLALIFKVKVNKQKRYSWEDENFKEHEDPFLQQFDEHGNFIPASQLEEEDLSSQNSDCTEDIQYRYDNTDNTK